MYTNQQDSGSRFSVPRAIATMMNHLAGETVFDHILARPEHPEQDGIYRKQFSRVLALFPDVPKDIRQLIFFDDCADPNFIGHSGIPSSAIHKSCWYKVEPYHRILNQKDVYESILYCLYTPFGDDVNALVEPILQYYVHFLPQDSSIPSAKPFMTACIALQRKYGYVSKAFMTDALNSLKPAPSILKES